MLRALLIVIACSCLSGCWVSEKRFFGSEEWARLDLAGTYAVKSAAGFDAPETVTLALREDGRLDTVRADGQAGLDEIEPLGLVAIPGGSGRFFLAVDQSGEVDYYYIAHLALDGGLAFYLPDCSGTPARNDLVIEEESKGGLTCVFASEEALLEAALEAERFLSARHIVAVSPVYSLERMADEAELQETE